MEPLYLVCLAVIVALVAFIVIRKRQRNPYAQAGRRTMSHRPQSAAACSLPSAARLETRGVFWLIAAFLFCPCHLPLTLGLFGLLLAGTAVGALVQGHPLAVGALVTAVWVAGTWRGFHLLNAARRFAKRATG